MNIIKFFNKIINKNKVEISNFGCQTLDLSGVQTKDELIKTTIKPIAFSNVHVSNIKTCNDLQNAFDCKENYNIKY